MKINLTPEEVDIVSKVLAEVNSKLIEGAGHGGFDAHGNIMISIASFEKDALESAIKKI